jgi:hypothetical protein
MTDTSSSPKRRQTVAARQTREKALMVEQLRKTPIVQVCCEKMGVARTTFYDWCKKDQEFAKAVDAALSDGTGLMNDLAESQLLSAVRDGNLGAITYWLKHRHPAYATKMEVKAELRRMDDSLTPEQQALVERALQLTGITDPSPHGE